MHAGITQIAIVVFVALLCGIGLTRIKQPPIVGYILAGLILGPSGLQLIQERELVNELAEMGVLLLLFLIGMELDLSSFRRVWKTTVGALCLQLLGCFIATQAIGFFLDWSLNAVLFLTFAIALSSTAVAVNMLESAKLLHTNTGRITIGILVAQDIAFIPMVLILRTLGGEGFDYLIILKLLGSIICLVALIGYLSRRDPIELPLTDLFKEYSELIPLASLGFCFGLAALMGLIDLSPAYGAFIAGLIVGNSSKRQKIIANTHPIQIVLMMVFFLSIGLLMDLQYIWDNLGTVLLIFFIITLFKTILNIAILHLFKQNWSDSFLSGLLLSQVGEFTFLMATVTLTYKVISPEQHKLIVSVTALCLVMSPVWYTFIKRLKSLSKRHLLSFSQVVDTTLGREIEACSNLAHKVSDKIKEKRNNDA